MFTTRVKYISCFLTYFLNCAMQHSCRDTNLWLESCVYLSKRLSFTQLFSSFSKFEWTSTKYAHRICIRALLILWYSNNKLNYINAMRDHWHVKSFDFGEHYKLAKKIHSFRISTLNPPFYIDTFVHVLSTECMSCMFVYSSSEY